VGITNTINRAELSAIYAAIKDMAAEEGPHMHALLTDSAVSLSIINQAVKHPNNVRNGLHKELAQGILPYLLETAKKGQTTKLGKVKSHTDVWGNEQADEAAKQAAKDPESCAVSVIFGASPLDNRYWPYKSQPGEQEKETSDEYRDAVPNLHEGLKNVIHPKCSTGYSRDTMCGPPPGVT
jgi:ribonuclease HI